jgi:hypothetical protein
MSGPRTGSTVIYPRGFLVVQPVGGVGEVCQLALGAILQALLRLFGEEESIFLTPENVRGHTHLGIGELRREPKECTIPIKHRSHGSRMRPCFGVAREIFA